MAAEQGQVAPGTTPRIWVVTVAHRGDDARIVHREIRSLRAAGLAVTLVAPLPPAESLGADPPGVRRIALARARGRRRLGSHLLALRTLGRARRRGEVDLVIVHDLELLAWVPLLCRRVPVVWDVHEDFLASVADRRYVPARLRPVVRALVRSIERVATRRCHLILAEDSYRARLGDHPVIPNATWVPDTVPAAGSDTVPPSGSDTVPAAGSDTVPAAGSDTVPPSGSDTVPAAGSATQGDRRRRVVYTGRIARARGVIEMIEIATQLRDLVRVQLIGEPDADVADLVAHAAATGVIEHVGYLPNPAAMELLPGALAGLSLLADIDNYRGSQPTKLIEYLAHGVPVISTPLPVAAQFVTDSGGGAVVSFEHIVEDTVATVAAWAADPDAARALGIAGHAHVRAAHAWQQVGDEFVALICAWARP